MNIIEAIEDEKLFRPFLGELGTWSKWGACLRALHGLPITSAASQRFIREYAGRDPAQLPAEGFQTALFLTGRRSGKSRISAVCGAYEAALSGREKRLAKGEMGMVAVISPSKHQSSIVKNYIRAIFDVPMLANEIVRETREGFELRNGVVVGILTSDWRTVRGFSTLSVILDECCFLGLDSDSKVRSDTELVRAILPSLATTSGRLIAISSPWAARGWAHRQWKRCFGVEGAKTLVVRAPSRAMNSTLPQSVVNEAMADDLAAARSEYLAEWREDVGQFLPREVIEQLVVQGRCELLPDRHRRPTAFADLSGGRNDDAALAIADQRGRTVVINLLRRYRPPFNPHDVIRRMCEELKRWNISYITGDNYAAEFCAASFAACGIGYIRCEKPKAQLYTELLPRLCSGEIELLDDPVLVDQLAALERRTRAGGKDVIDHPPGGHDDLANAIAGVAVGASAPVRICGAF